MIEDISLAKKVRSMFKKLAEIRHPYESDYEDIAKYVFYRREFFDLETEQGQSIARTKFDDTARDAASNLAHGFQGYMVSRSIKWLSYQFANPELENYKEAMIWLEDLEHYFYESLKNSNFYDAVNDNLNDAVTFGMPCMYSENDEKQDKIIYSERHPIEIYIAINRYGVADTVFRKYKMSSREIVKQFDESKVSIKIKDEAEKSQSMYNEHIIIHGMFPNEDKVVGSLQSKDKAYRSVYIEEDATEEDLILDDKGYDTNPYITWWWNRNSTEWYARSPSHNALPRVLMLNQIEKAILEAVDKTVRPPTYAPAKHKGRIRLYPGGINYYENYEQERIEAINQNIKLPITMDERQDMREEVKRCYFNDFFLILSQLMGQGQRTATEILKIEGEKAAIIGPIIGRYESKFLDLILERKYQLDYEAGRLPQMPPVLEDMGEETIRIKYTGPLAQIQERLYTTTGIMHTLSSLLPVAEMQLSGAPIVDKFDFDVMAEELSETHDMPQRVMRGDREVKKIREQRAAAQQAMQEMEIAKGAADAVPKVNKKVEKGSVLEEMMGKK